VRKVINRAEVRGGNIQIRARQVVHPRGEVLIFQFAAKPGGGAAVTNQFAREGYAPFGEVRDWVVVVRAERVCVSNEAPVINGFPLAHNTGQVAAFLA